MRTRTYLASVATAGLLAFPAYVAADTDETAQGQQDTGTQTEMQTQQDTDAQTDLQDDQERAADDPAMTQEGEQAETDMMEGDTQQAQADEHGFISQPSSDSVSTQDLMDYSVMGQQGEEIASIEEVVLTRDGEIEALVLSSGGMLGMGDKTFAVEWDAVELDPEQQEIRTQFTEDQIENAPEYEDSQNGAGAN